MQQTDKCNAEYEAQLNVKHEKLRQQLKYLNVVQQNVIELNHQLENNSNKGIRDDRTFGILRQNTNYRSLPLSAKLRSLTDDTVQQIGQRIEAQQCQDTEKFDASAYEVVTTSSSKSTVDHPSGNNFNLSSAVVIDVACSSAFPSAVNSDKWNVQTGDSISHSENLRNTSHRMIGRYACLLYTSPSPRDS